MSTVVVVVISCSSCKFLVPLRHGLVKVSFEPGHTIDKSFSTLGVLGFCVPNVQVFLVHVKPSLGLFRCPLWCSSCAMPCARTFRSSTAWPDSVCFSIFSAVQRSCSLRPSSVRSVCTSWKYAVAPCTEGAFEPSDSGGKERSSAHLRECCVLGCHGGSLLPSCPCQFSPARCSSRSYFESLSTSPAVFCTWWEAVGRCPLLQNEVEDVGPQTHPHAQGSRVRRGNHRLSTTACVPNGQLGQPCDLHLHVCLMPFSASGDLCS